MFTVVMGSLTGEFSQEPPWTVRFAENTVICTKNGKQFEESLEKWRCGEKRNESLIEARQNTCVNDRETNGNVTVQGAEVVKIV